MTNPCLTCVFANWYRTTNGRLHPSGNGLCTWEMPQVNIPKIKYWMYNKQPSPNGSIIERKDERECLTHKPKKTRIKL